MNAWLYEWKRIGSLDLWKKKKNPSMLVMQSNVVYKKRSTYVVMNVAPVINSSTTGRRPRPYPHDQPIAEALSQL